MAEIVIEVKTNGQATVEADGVKGAACTLHTQPYIKALGVQTESLPKGDMFEQPLAQEQGVQM